MRRRLRTIAIFLLAWAVVNVAVAWGCALWSPWRFGEQTSLERATSVWEEYAPPNAPSFDGPQTDAIGIGYKNSSAYASAPGGIFRAGETRAGLPLKSVRGGFGVIHPGGIVLYRWAVRVPFSHRLIPYRPIMLGSVVNTLLYSAVLWLLIPVPFVLRRFLRVRRGLCPKCAYPMGESAVCTECGRELPRGLTTDRECAS